jgi:hypothetical protein
MNIEEFALITLTSASSLILYSPNQRNFEVKRCILLMQIEFQIVLCCTNLLYVRAYIQP